MVLSRRVPRDKWGETLGRIGRDVMGLVKARYGDNEFVRIAERAMDKALLPPATDETHRRVKRQQAIGQRGVGYWVSHPLALPQ